MDAHLPPFWREHLLAVLGGQRNTQTLRLLDAWARAEGGTARWNPLNTTLLVAEFTLSPDYNKTGVRNYSAPVAGVCATALTLISHKADGKLRFGGILADIQAGTKTADQIVRDRSDEFQTWGTSPALMLQILAG